MTPALVPPVGGRPVIRVEGVGKRFGGTQALSGVHLGVEAGSIHALVGENGAGKSTLLGILTGRVRPTEGQVEVFGRRIVPGSPRAARACGIAAIYQELTIVPALSAGANVFLGRCPSRFGLLDEARMRSRYDQLCSRLEVRIPYEARARRLSPAQQQVLEIMRALDSDARVLLLDEPTACLGLPEREALFRLMTQLRDDGVAMVFVSHELDEVLRVADRVTVLRAGRVATSGAVGGWTKESLVRVMIGRAVPAGPPALRSCPAGARGAAPSGVELAGAERGEVELVRVQGLAVDEVLSGVHLVVRRGEIVGVGGLVGSGRSTLLRCLAGLEHPSAGRLWVGGRPVAWPRSVRAALRLGLALVPEDRKTQGLLAGLTARENVTVSDLAAVTYGPVISNRMMRQRAGEVASVFGFGPDRLDEPVRRLSGGNQQKLLLSRWRHRRPKVLLADEPCRGIDAGSKADIMRALRRQADEGMGVLLVSSQLEEVAGVADRVLVLAGGRSAATLEAGGAPITASRILLAAHGLGPVDG